MMRRKKLNLKNKKVFSKTGCAKICCVKGSGTTDVLIVGAVIVFVLLPVFSAIMERYILFAKTQVIKDAMDITNLSAYYALETEILGKGCVDFSESRVLQIYREMLAKNLQLDADLNPLEGSIVDCQVRIESVIIYTGDFPATCPYGTVMIRSAVHSSIVVPVKPVFFREIIMSLSGKEYTELKVHVDSDIPINK